MAEGKSTDKRKDISFQIVSAFRELVNIAKKDNISTTYEQAFDLLYDVDPKLYALVIEDLPLQNQNEIAKLAIAKAQVLEVENPEKLALAGIQSEIDLNEILLQKKSSDTKANDRIKKRQYALIAAKKSFEERKLTEHRILERDFSKVDRTDFGAQFIEQDVYKVDYKLENHSYLRIRLLHPERMEAVTGADLIYEQQDLDSRKIRVMFLQYKVWDESGKMYFKQGSLETQLRKMSTILCEKGFCDPPEHLTGHKDYRFPYCSCFLRQTDTRQNTTSRLMSTGIHVPVCTALEVSKAGGLSLNKRELRTQALTHSIFEPLFNKSFIGSRWLDESELKDFYVQNGILSQHDTIMIYAREIIEQGEYSDEPF